MRVIRLLPFALLLGLTAIGAARAQPQQCPDNFVAFKEETDPLVCTCPAEATQSGSVWGTDVYTADSSVCRAAVHAGAVGRRGGQVTVIGEPGRRSYYGTTRNGLSSINYASYGASFRFALAPAGTPASPAPGPSAPATTVPGVLGTATAQQCPDNFIAFKDETDPLACTCPAEATQGGAVWGTDVYTADSSVCRAALHAGVVSRRGGPVTVMPMPGRGSYYGTTRNGLSSTNYGSYEASFQFANPASSATAGPATRPATPSATAAAVMQCPDNFIAFKDETDPVACTCPAEATQGGAVWGTDVYTADSSVCRAALHAGMVGRAGGPVTVLAEPGRRSYPGTTRNGLSSNNYGQYEASFRFGGSPARAASAPQSPAQGAAAIGQCPDDFVAFKDNPDPLVCTCPAEATQRGSVWGTDVYTADSGLCRAALHAGAIGRLGGQITATAQPGRRSYPGTTRNGLSSSNYGPYDASVQIAGSGQRSAAPVQASIGQSLKSTGQVNLYIQFRTGSADLDISSAAVLGELLAVLREDPALRLQLIGHTDTAGTRATNQPLSIRRAEAVRTWLASQGIDAGRLTASGRGQDEPIAPNTTEDGKALNRRVQAARAR